MELSGTFFMVGSCDFRCNQPASAPRETYIHWLFAVAGKHEGIYSLTKMFYDQQTQKASTILNPINEPTGALYRNKLMLFSLPTC